MKDRAPRERPRPAALEVIARSDREAVVFKPAGLSSERPNAGGAAKGAPQSDSLIERARAQLQWPDAQLPHRLDRPTRGLVVISRDRAAAAMHADEIRARAWSKWYVARIPSRAADSSGRDAVELLGPHSAYLRREGSRARAVRSGGDPSRLTILAVARAADQGNECHALIDLETGRFHQIRVMLANLGFALVGDDLYGGGTRHEEGREDQLDLEAVALRIARPAGPVVFRLAAHADRRGVAPEIERALDRAIAADVSDGPAQR